MNINVITHHSTSGLREKQYFKLEKPISKHTADYLVKEYPYLFNESDLAALNYLYSLSINHPSIHPSLEMIASHMGKCKRTAQRAIKKLKELGLVSTYQRWNNTLLYKIADVFQDSGLRSALSLVCPVFKFLLIAWLFCPAVLPGYHQPGPSRIQVKTPDVHVENNLYIKTPAPSHTSDIVTTALALLYENIQDTSKYKKAPPTQKRRLMSIQEPEISQAIRGLGIFRLTKYGQIKLSPYPDEAIFYAVQRYKESKTRPTDKFAWFAKVCLIYCQHHNIEPNWLRMQQLKEKYRMPENARMIFEDDDSPFAGTTTPIAAATRAGAGKKKEEKEAYQPRPTVIPQKREWDREELIKQARILLFPEKGPGFPYMEPLYKARLKELAEQHPDVIIEAQGLGPIPMISPEEGLLRSEERLRARGVRPQRITITAPRPEKVVKSAAYPREMTPLEQKPSNLTTEESYSSIDVEDGDCEEVIV